MKKLFITMMLLAILLVGCGNADKKSEGAGATEGMTAKCSILEIKDAMVKADASLPEMNLADSSMDNASNLFAYVSNMDYSKVSEYAFSYAAEGSAEEIAIIKLKDKGDVAEMQTSIESHVATRIKQFENYDPSQVPMCKEAVVFSNGNYVVLIICKDNASVKKAFYSCFE